MEQKSPLETAVVVQAFVRKRKKIFVKVTGLVFLKIRR